MSTPSTPKPTPLNVRVLDLGPMTVVGLEGALDRTNVGRVDEQLRRALQRDSTTIVLDCSLLASLGGDEVAVLADACDEIREHDGRLVLGQPNAQTRDRLACDSRLETLEI